MGFCISRRLIVISCHRERPMSSHRKTNGTSQDVAPSFVWSGYRALFIVRARSAFDLPGRAFEHFETNTLGGVGSATTMLKIFRNVFKSVYTMFATVTTFGAIDRRNIDNPAQAIMVAFRYRPASWATTAQETRRNMSIPVS